MDENNAPTPDPNPLDLKKTVQLSPTDTVRVFISYACEDQQLHEKLVKYLVPLKNSGKITIWHDKEILPGTEWDEQIKTRLKEADMILLLVSADFLASDYCYGVEMQQALKRHKDGEARVIPIILKPADWQDPLGRLQALPTGAKAVTQWDDQDVALADVVQGIRKVVENLLREDRQGKIGELLGEFINSALPKVKEIVTLNSQKLSLINYFLLISFLVGVSLYFLINDMSLLNLVIDSFLVIVLVILLIRVEGINAHTPVKTGERRVLLSAVPLGFLAILGSSLLREGNVRRELENGSLTQLRMGLLPNDTPSMGPFENSLSDFLGIPVSSVYPGKTYEDTINALGKGDVEVGWLGAISYLRAHQKYGVRVILCKLAFDQKKTYQCYIITNPKANIHGVGDLKGKRFALTDPSGTSGRLIPLYELKKAGLDPNKDIEAFYAGSHLKVLEQVLSDQAHAGAVSSDVYYAALRDGTFQTGALNILDVGENIDIPVGPIVVRKDIQHYDELRIEDAFLTVAERDPSVIHTMGIGGIAKAIHESYEFLLPIAQELNIKIEELD